jgi:putative flippase GtrA
VTIGDGELAMPLPGDERAGEPGRSGLGGVRVRLGALRTDERAAFVLMGALNTAFAFGVFISLQLTLGRHVHYLVILLLTHVLGVLEAFAAYRYRVFKVRGNVLVDLLRFESVNLVAFAINLAMLPLLVEVCSLPVILAQVVVLLVVTLGTFLGHKHFSFRRRGLT